MNETAKQLRAAYYQWNSPPSPELPQGAEVCFKAADELDRLAADLANAQSDLSGVQAILDAERTELDAIRAELSAARAALLLARETLPSLDALPVTRTRLREIVEAVDAAIGAASSAGPTQQGETT